MKNVCLIGAIIFAQFVFASGMETALLPHGIVTNLSDEVLETRRFNIGDRNMYLKQGAGTLEMPVENFDQVADAKIGIQSGRLDLSKGVRVAPAQEVLSDTVKAKLLFWFQVDDANSAHLVKEGDLLTRWYDVRETNVSAPTYSYAQAETTYGTAPKVCVAEYVITNSASSQTTQTWQAVYFNGLGSGTRMTVQTAAGAAEKTFCGEVFAIHGVVGSWGYLFGANNASVDEFPILTYGYKTTPTLNRYFWNETWGPLAGGSFWLDGTYFDAQQTAVSKGLHLLEARLSPGSNFGRHHAFFSYSASYSPTTTMGGDYLSEVMYFKTRLTETERLQVQNYLSHKWLEVSNPTKNIEIASGAALGIAAAENTTVKDLKINASGAGTIIKSGVGAWEIAKEEADTLRPAAIDLQGGSLVARMDVPLKVRAGDRFVASVDAGDTSNVITRVSDAGEGTVIKDGTGRITFAGLPANVKRLIVKGGDLVIAAPVTNACKDVTGAYEVPIPNHSFEEWEGSDRANAGMIALPSKAYTTAYSYGGWRYATGGHPIYWYDYDVWSAKGTDVPAQATIGAVGLTIAPPDGRCAAFLKQCNGVMATSVTITEPGEYALSAMIYGRSSARAGGIMAKLVNKSDVSLVADFGTLRFMWYNKWTPVESRVNITQAGTFELRLQNHAGWGGNESRDLGVVIDDIHLRRLGDINEGTYAIPGGTFEEADLVTAGDPSSEGFVYTAFTNANTIAGWTFVNPSGWTSSKPAVGLVTPWMTLYAGRAYSDAFIENTPWGGGVELALVKKDAQAKATFTPPAGTWYVKLQMARKNDDSTALDAAVQVGEQSAIALGSIAITDKRMVTKCYPTPFVADGVTPVTLALTLNVSANSSTQGMIVDNVQLVRAYEGDAELINDPSFESKSWTMIAGVSTKGADRNCEHQNYGEYLQFFGTSYGTGKVMLELKRDAGFYRTVTIPRAGRYRFAFSLKRRIGERVTPVDVTFSKSGVTNWVDHLIAARPGIFERRTYVVKFAEAGTWTLCFKGLDEVGYIGFDDISLKWQGPFDYDFTPFGNRDLAITLQNGARLFVDFEGAADVMKIVSDGTYSEEASANRSTSLYAGRIFGTGDFTFHLPGTVIFVR